MTQYYKDMAPRMYEKAFGEGRIKGKAEGRIEGRAEGKQEMGLEMGSRLVSSGACSLESVAKASGIPIESFVEYIKKNL